MKSACFLFGLILGVVLAGTWNYSHAINYGNAFPGGWFIFGLALFLSIVFTAVFFGKDDVI